ncbi:MAG: hypothetical protein R3E97_17050 [Candidatus Eisenbacteria bacterium]
MMTVISSSTSGAKVHGAPPQGRLRDPRIHAFALCLIALLLGFGPLGCTAIGVTTGYLMDRNRSDTVGPSDLRVHDTIRVELSNGEILRGATVVEIVGRETEPEPEAIVVSLEGRMGGVAFDSGSDRRTLHPDEVVRIQRSGLRNTMILGACGLVVDGIVAYSLRGEIEPGAFN